MKDDRLYLHHIHECINRVLLYVSEGKNAFLKDFKSQDAVLRNLHTLTESAQRLSLQLKEQHREIDWRGISGFRNVIVHDYLGVNFHRIWDIIQNDLPPLKKKIEEILSSLGENF